MNHKPFVVNFEADLTIKIFSLTLKISLPDIFKKIKKPGHYQKEGVIP
jgi:hypothetical protein